MTTPEEQEQQDLQEEAPTPTEPSNGVQASATGDKKYTIDEYAEKHDKEMVKEFFEEHGIDMKDIEVQEYD